MLVAAFLGALLAMAFFISSVLGKAPQLQFLAECAIGLVAAAVMLNS
jgi:hypothetical protein